MWAPYARPPGMAYQHGCQSAGDATLLHSSDCADPNTSGALSQSFTEIFPQH
jgi:hypothetical protein